MGFILVPNESEVLHVNAWNWRPTLELLLAAGVITEDDYDRMGCQGCDGKVDAEKAARIADAVAQKLDTMNPAQRVLADQSISSEPKKFAVFSPDKDRDIDANELYSNVIRMAEYVCKFLPTFRRLRGKVTKQ